MPTAAGALGKRCRPSPGIGNSGDSTVRALEQPYAATAPTPAGMQRGQDGLGKERVRESRGTEQGAELGDAASPPAAVPPGVSPPVPPHLRARARPPRVRAAAGRGRGGRRARGPGWDRARGNEERARGTGVLPYPGKGAAPGRCRSSSAPPLPAKVAGNPTGGPAPRGPIALGEGRRDAAARQSRGGKGGRWHRDPPPTPAPGTAPLSAGKETPVAPGRRLGDTAGHLRGPSPVSRAPREGSRVPRRLGYHPTRARGPAVLPRPCGARGAPIAAAGGPEVPARTAGAARGSHRDGVRPRSTCPGKGASRSGTATFPGAAQGAAGWPRWQPRTRVCSSLLPAIRSTRRECAEPPAPGSPSGPAAVRGFRHRAGKAPPPAPGPGPLPPPLGSGPRLAAAAGAVPGVGPPPGPGHRATWRSVEPSRGLVLPRILRSTPVLSDRSRTCPAGCAAPRQPRGGRAESRVGREPGCPRPPPRAAVPGPRPPPPRLAPRQGCANPPAPPLTGSRAREAPPP
ncbi:basic proline-rich protein-like [Corvus cornix cornix]|uniref:basic proline-rich protein-like n=1 Tax=Corvus cornix cornix TaxID=932674 RepID=UPI00194EBA32|nr:basic proline-rich protein-like [Corvus cornix cornix]